MTQGIEKMLNLPSMDEIFEIEGGKKKSKVPTPDTDDLLPAFEPNYGDAMLPTVAVDRDAEIEEHRFMESMPLNDIDESMDEIHETTLKHANDLMELGYNVDQRSMATIFEKANMLYKTALDAKSTKMDMHLKAKKLLLDQRKLNLEEKKLNHEMGDRKNDVDAESTTIVDRNDMIRRLREAAKQEKLALVDAKATEIVPETPETDEDK